MTPTREEFQAVAEWCGVYIYDWGNSGDPIVDDNGPLRLWQPHLPGIDSMRLMASFTPDLYWTHESVVVEFGRTAELVIKIEEPHNDTQAGRLQALASAVWQCAVNVAMEPKR